MPEAASRKVDEKSTKEDDYGAKDYTNLELKRDFQARPLWVVSLLNVL